MLATACSASPAATPATCANDSGLTLPDGFCASVFADAVGHARHLVVSPAGVIYVNTRSDGDHGKGPAGFLIALQDTRGAGVANVIKRFGNSGRSGAGGTGIALYHDWLYAEVNDKIVRYRLTGDAVVPTGQPQVIVSGLPLGGDHPMHPFTIDAAAGALYVDVASATNSCQVKNRTLNSPGIDPCVELKTRGGVWRYDANRADQKFSPRQRYATGIRNAEGFAQDRSGRLYVTQHGRDQLRANWPALYEPEQEATLPAEEILLLKEGGDYGWPECYYDPVRRQLVLAPEYGGDGGKTVGVCADKIGPVAAYPAHWAPNDMMYYGNEAFPAPYRDGLFIAFHGSWDRAPYAQGGYNVVYQSLSTDAASSRCEIFASGFEGGVKTPAGAQHRPSGLAVGPDGALYVSDDVAGRIYRIVYSGSAGETRGRGRPCPDPAAGAGPVSTASTAPPALDGPTTAAREQRLSYIRVGQLP
ncbi:MAG: sorbosone dehydrogenase family protein [Steroidobacteraceae bacterium]